MAIGSDTFAYRRHLPHIEKSERTYFVTFATVDRLLLPPNARDIAFACCLHDHLLTYFLHTVIVMPDHVHMLFSPYEEWPLAKIMKRVKGNSSRQINIQMVRRGSLWQDESFDRILRSHEDVRKKGEYIAQNPVRAGLVSAPEEYPWLWQEWRTGNPACPQKN